MQEEEENLWPDSPEEDALVIDEGNVEGPLSPLSSADRGEALRSKPLRILVEREEPPSFRVDVEGDDVAVVGALDATPTSSRRAAECPFPGGRRNTKAVPPIYDVTKEEEVVGMEKWGVGATPEKKGEERRGGRSGRLCWNCEGDHLIGDCKSPRNPANIMRNRKVFMESRNKQQSSSTSTGPQRRYHEESEATKEVVPGGVLSPELRHALGLSGGQLPMHIYRMRIYGYPPGWLQKVKETSTPLRVYDPRRKDFFAKEQVDFLYEREHIIEYPGYNVPLPQGFVDECRKLNFPPMHESDSIGAYLARLNAPEVAEEERRRFNESFGGSRGRRLLGSPPPKNSDLLGKRLLETPEREDWTGMTSMESLDTPVVNSGARLGCGRGRFRPSDDSEVVKAGVGRGRGGALPSHIRLPPSTSTATSKNKEEAAGSSGLLPTPDIPPIDARYLPRVPQSKSLLRKSARPRSPSLLRPGGGGVVDDDEGEVDLVEERPHSPTIVNLPPFVESAAGGGCGGGRSLSSSSSTTGGSASYKASGSGLVVDLEKEDGECDTTFDSTVTVGRKASMSKSTHEQILIDLVEEDDENEVRISTSSSAPVIEPEGFKSSAASSSSSRKGRVPESSTRSSFPSKRRARERSTVELVDEDSTSLLINERSSSETVGCIDVESDEYIPPSKKSKEVSTPPKPTSKPKEVVVELESSGEEGGSCGGGGSDWERSSSGSNKRKRGCEEPVGVARVGGASDSETGDEEVESQPNGDVTLTYKKRKLGGDDEDWETEESPAQQQHTVYHSTITANLKASTPTAEFIPANSQLEAMKAVILSTSLEEDEDDDEIEVIGEVKGSSAAVKSKEKVKNYTAASSLPSYDKFAAGMPTMVFEEDGAAPSGRFDKVLDILRQKKANRGK